MPLSLGLGNKINKYAIQPTACESTYVAASQSVYLDGNTDYLMCIDDADFTNTTGTGAGADKPFSFAMWVKANGTSNQNYGLVEKGSATPNEHEYRIFILSGKIYFDLYTDITTTYIRVNTKVAHTYKNTWNHYVFTFNGDTTSNDITSDAGETIQRKGLSIYVNGQAQDISSGTGGSYDGMKDEASNVYFGHLISTPNYDLNGFMTDIMYWQHYMLNYREVNDIYADGVYSFNPTTKACDYSGRAYLKLWLKCDADYTITAAQSSTTFVDSAEEPATPAGGSVTVIDEEHGSYSSCPSSLEHTCYRVVDPNGVAAVTGIQDETGAGNHGQYGGGANITTGSGNVPTATSI